MSERKRILVADADSLESDFFVLMLDKLGYNVEAAMDGKSALEKIRHGTWDLIIMESALPQVSGWSVLKTIKADEKLAEIPVILLSGVEDVKEEVDAFELGVEDYIRKPFNFSVVIARIRRRVGGGEKVKARSHIKEPVATIA
jgi:DNA-binding response OmpR family regulator